MRLRFVLGLLVAVLGACSDAGDPPASDAVRALPPSASPSAFARILTLRRQFPSILTPGEAPASDPTGAHSGAARPARVDLPARASGLVRVQDDASGLAVAFTLEGAGDATLALADGLALYEAALPGGADLIHRARPDGTEDYVAFARKPDREELVYRVDVSRAAGLRLVGGQLELLDAAGAPRLRVAPPYVVDAGGARHAARLAVEGCAHDTDPRAPWGRAVTAPGAASCAVRVSWQDVAYPALVDPAWTTTGTMASARYIFTASLLATGKVLVAGGQLSSPPLKLAELYDPVSKTWSATGSMVSRRMWHSAALLPGGDVLVAGGFDGGAGLSSAERYDATTGTWSLTGSMAAPRYLHTESVFANGKVLVAAGIGGNGPIATVEVYDATTAVWTAVGSLMKAREFHTATTLKSGGVLIAGGSDAASQRLASVELLDPLNGWVTVPDMAGPRELHTATLLPDGKVLVAGGDDNNTLKSAEIYDPALNAWSPAAPMSTVRAYHAASLLGGGRVLVTGGASGQALTEAYDPPSNTWVPSGNLITARNSHAEVTLPDGSILIAGGILDGSVTPLASAERFSLTADGAPCAQGTECNSGHCADGVCCDTACAAGPCDACSVAAGAPSNGTCALLTGATCDDGNACTQMDACQIGVCTGASPVVCPAPDACHAAGVCAPSTGQCADASMPDGTACPGGACTGGTCVATADGGAGGAGGGGGGGGAGAASTASSSASSGAAASSSGSPPVGAKGCSCGVAGSSDAVGGVWGVGLLVLAAARRRRPAPGCSSRR